MSKQIVERSSSERKAKQFGSLHERMAYLMKVFNEAYNTQETKLGPLYGAIWDLQTLLKHCPDMKFSGLGKPLVERNYYKRKTKQLENPKARKVKCTWCDDVHVSIHQGPIVTNDGIKICFYCTNCGSTFSYVFLEKKENDHSITFDLIEQDEDPEA